MPNRRAAGPPAAGGGRPGARRQWHGPCTIRLRTGGFREHRPASGSGPGTSGGAGV